MFGKRSASNDAPPPQAAPSAAVPPKTDAPPRTAAPGGAVQRSEPVKPSAARVATDNRSEDYYQIKTTIFSALIDTIDLAQLAQLDPDSAREEIRDIVNEIISIKN
ncbi:MAG: CpaF family protein, partial [Rhizomicrobium sp.]